MFRWQLVLFPVIAGLGSGSLQAEPKADSATLGLRAQQHLFVYYPERDIYYAPAHDRWFWREEDGWREADSLPVRHADALNDGVQLRLDTPNPRLRHEVVRRHYAGMRLSLIHI